MPIDVKNIRLGETGMDELLAWLRQMGQPQRLEAITYEYLSILRSLVFEGQEQV
ncbi:MAG: hypothetical protein KatS3mg057_2954 [Herpetosiphonaceae bacterium]|nr:MAG: hypothetical protein KatS3mg057_2954 [Herpetosiphonaceae bacterium]